MQEIAIMAEEWDRIRRLGGKGMIDHIMDKIFGSLDFEALQNAEAASQNWKCIIKNGKFWETLLKRNVTFSMDWMQMLAILQSLEPVLLADGADNNSQGQYRWASCSIGKKLKLLEDNWKSGSFVEHQWVWKPPFLLMGLLHSFNQCAVQFTLGIPWIVTVCQNGQEILLRDRFRQKAHEILTLPIVRINLSQRRRKLRIYCVTANERFIVASFCDHVEVCVWSAVTTELLWVLGGDVFDHENWQGIYYMPNFYPLVHCLWDSLLLIFNVGKSGTEKTLTLWKLHSNLENDPVILCRKIVTEQMKCVLNMYMDSKFAVLLAYDLQGSSSKIETRSLETLDLIATIEDWSRLGFFHYNSGITVSGMGKRFIKVWNAATGEQLRTIAYQDSLSGIRLIKDKYIVTCDNQGKVKIWDLKAALNPSISSSRLLLRILPTPQKSVAASEVGVCMEADDYQIALLIPFDRRSSYLHIKDFLGDWHEEVKSKKKAAKRAKRSEDYSD